MAHANHDRWMVSYADFVTLLFALFVVLFASSQHDKSSIRTVSQAVKNGFQELGAFDGSASIEQFSASTAPKAKGPGTNIADIQAKLYQALGNEIQKHQVVLTSTPEGFVISLHELGFFDSGQAQLLPGAAETIQRIGGIMTQYRLQVRIEGHSDDVPIHNAVFDSNWELSTARANSVAKILLEDPHFDPRRLSIAGYAQYHPSASNETPEGRRSNRRVDLVIVSSAS